MEKLLSALEIEMLKIKQSRIFWITLIVIFIAPVMGGLFMLIMKNPGFVLNSGLLKGKSETLITKADWPSFFFLLEQIISVGGIMIFGFVASWVFGREYSDRTVKDLLALPIPRETIVLSKFIAIFLWCLFLSVITLLAGILIGAAIGLPGGSAQVFSDSVQVFSISALLTILLCFPVGFFASIGRGFLSPLAFVAITLVFSQIIAAIGFGTYFPWSVPALFSGAAGSADLHLGFTSYFILLFVSFLGVVGTCAWWKFADQK